MIKKKMRENIAMLKIVKLIATLVISILKTMTTGMMITMITITIYGQCISVA